MIIDPYTWNRLPIERLEVIAEDTLSVQVSRPTDYNYQAGQYAVVRAEVNGSSLLRQYSLASCPDNDFLEFLIQREPSGTVTNWFHETATVGTTIEISQPLGAFTATPDDRPLLFIAGRVGVAPFIGMVRDQLSRQPDRPVTVLYSARGDAQFCYRDLLSAVSTEYYDTLAGKRLTADELTRHVNESVQAYICGSKQFVDAVRQLLEAAGVPAAHIRRELFTLQ